jgi:hypothetical protein
MSKKERLPFEDVGTTMVQNDLETGEAFPARMELNQAYCSRRHPYFIQVNTLPLEPFQVLDVEERLCRQDSLAVEAASCRRYNIPLVM